MCVWRGGLKERGGGCFNDTYTTDLHSVNDLYLVLKFSLFVQCTVVYFYERQYLKC